MIRTTFCAVAAQQNPVSLFRHTKSCLQRQMFPVSFTRNTHSSSRQRSVTRLPDFWSSPTSYCSAGTTAMRCTHVVSLRAPRRNRLPTALRDLGQTAHGAYNHAVLRSSAWTECGARTSTNVSLALRRGQQYRRTSCSWAPENGDRLRGRSSGDTTAWWTCDRSARQGFGRSGGITPVAADNVAAVRCAV